MPLKTTRLTFILLGALAIVACAFVYVKYRNFSNYLAGEINSLTGKKLGRQFKFASVKFSPMDGIVITEPCVSRAPDFTKGSFFCAKRASIRPDIAALLKNRVAFSKVELLEPAIKLREAGGRWDFEDLLALLPKTAKGLHLTWNARELILKNAIIDIEFGSSDRALTLENADIKLSHYSSLAGNFSLEFKGDIKSAIKGQLLGAKATLKSDLNFEYAGLVSAFGALELRDAVFGASTLDNADLKWELFNISEPAAKKNYSLSLKTGGIFIPGQSGGAKASVNKALEILDNVAGRRSQEISDIEARAVSLDFSLKDAVIAVKNVKVDANFMSLDSSILLDGKRRTVDINFAANLGKNKLALLAKGPMDRPEITPAMSVTLNAKLIDAVKAVNTYLLKLFPVLQ